MKRTQFHPCLFLDFDTLLVLWSRLYALRRRRGRALEGRTSDIRCAPAAIKIDAGGMPVVGFDADRAAHTLAETHWQQVRTDLSILKEGGVDMRALGGLETSQGHVNAEQA